MISNKNKYISLLLKFIVILFAVWGIVICINARTDTFMGGASVLMYFTIQSNILIALISLIGMVLLFNKNIPNWWFIIKFVGTVAITLTGGVFCFILAPTFAVGAWSQANVFTHVIVPLASIIDFFVVGIYSNIKKIKVLYTLIPPFLYVIYAYIGYRLNWQFGPNINYPYFFLNWGSPLGAFGFSKEMPLMGCIWWILLLMILILIVSLIYLSIINLMKNKSDK